MGKERNSKTSQWTIAVDQRGDGGSRTREQWREKRLNFRDAFKVQVDGIWSTLDIEGEENKGIKN